MDETCERVFDAIGDLFSYPQWWPEVERVEHLNGSQAVVVIRAALPYKLRFNLERRVFDRASGIIEASMTGDLEGWSRWSVIPREAGCSLLFEEEVKVNRPLLRALAPVARPLLQANHGVMMRRGERGLRAFLIRNSRYPSRVGVNERHSRSRGATK